MPYSICRVLWWKFETTLEMRGEIIGHPTEIRITMLTSLVKIGKILRTTRIHIEPRAYDAAMTDINVHTMIELGDRRNIHSRDVTENPYRRPYRRAAIIRGLR